MATYSAALPLEKYVFDHSELLLNNEGIQITQHTLAYQGLHMLGIKPAI